MSAADDVQVVLDPDLVPATPSAAAPLPVLTTDGDILRPQVPVDFPEGATLQQDGSVILQLYFPNKARIRFADGAGNVSERKFPTLHLNRLTGKHLREVRNGDPADLPAAALAAMAGISTGRALLLHDALDAADIGAYMRVWRFFTTPGQRTGQ